MSDIQLRHIPAAAVSVKSEKQRRGEHPVDSKEAEEWRLVDAETLEETPEGIRENEALFERLERLLEKPEFADRLENHRQRSTDGSSSETNPPREDDSVDSASDGSFVIVDKEDALEGMLQTIASCVLSCPEAQNIRPEELQEAIVDACKQLKKSRAKSAWGWCKFIYRTASWTYTAFNLYANPWIVRALLAAFWAFPSLFGRFFF